MSQQWLRSVLSTVHDLITHAKEQIAREGLGEEVSKIVDGADVRHLNKVLLHLLADKEVASGNVLDTLVMFWIISKTD